MKKDLDELLNWLESVKNSTKSLPENTFKWGFLSCITDLKKYVFKNDEIELYELIKWLDKYEEDRQSLLHEYEKDTFTDGAVTATNKIKKHLDKIISEEVV